MGKTVIPEGYRSLLSLYETQKAISLLKRLFEDTPRRCPAPAPGVCPPVRLRLLRPQR